MRIFMTGASGFVGSAVVPELLAAGHEVHGLARSDAAAAKLVAAGVTPVPGSLTDHAILREGAAAAEAVIHCGFSHDFSRFKESCDNERIVIATFAEAMRAGGPIVVTSGVGLLPGQRATEETRVPADSPNPRVASEAAVEQALAGGANAIRVRLPIVHGDDDPGFLAILIGLAREKGVSAYPGDGSNNWPAVHRLDVGRLYRLALEQGQAGDVFHAVAEEGVAFRDLATVIGQRLDLPAKGLAPEEVAAHFTWFAHFATMNAKASSERTREALGWTPEREGLIEDLEGSRSYFMAA